MILSLMVRPPASTREKLDWLRLIRTENIGPVTFRTLMSRFGNAARVLEALPDLAVRAGGKGQPRIPSIDAIQAEFEMLRALGGQILAIGEAQYPALLALSEGAPPILSIIGRADLLSRDFVALVGSRNASAAGVRIASILASELGTAGYAVVSGLARGIDTAAHKASLKTGTVGVVAGGVDNIYPPENRALFETMKSEGAIISEMPLGAAPQAQHFPRRNRLISGLARAVIVVEAAERSGSLITARFAAEQGRDVLAVPGSPLDPRCRGANLLIRDGATLIQDSADVLEVLGSARAPSPGPNGQFEDVGPGSEDLIDALRPKLIQLLGGRKFSFLQPKRAARWRSAG